MSEEDVEAVSSSGGTMIQSGAAVKCEMCGHKARVTIEDGTAEISCDTCGHKHWIEDVILVDGTMYKERVA